MSEKPLTPDESKIPALKRQIQDHMAQIGPIESKDFLSLRGRFARYLAGGLADIFLLGLLSFSRRIDSRREAPDTTLRLLSGVDAVQINNPPPPPPPEPPPPPPKTPPLPKLDIEIKPLNLVLQFID